MEDNARILSIVLKQYFDDLTHLNTEIRIYNYYYKFLDTINDNPNITWKKLGDEYKIKDIFKNISPTVILSQMEILYYDITYVVTDGFM